MKLQVQKIDLRLLKFMHVKKRMNLFSSTYGSTEGRNIANIDAGVLIEKEKNMLHEYISDGDKAYNEFVKATKSSYLIPFRKT